MGDDLNRLRQILADRYAVEQELGHGGMAVVYLAKDLKHDRKVAIKVLRQDLGREAAERFLREIRTVAQLHHPHILQLLDSGTAGDHLFYVMPYVEGETIRQRLEREGPLPLDEAVRITREVADALAFAHARNIVHRDIKPENIFLSAGHALVADFGIARATDAAGTTLTDAGLAVGTPTYMSPEQATADPRVDGRSDQYALGCVLYRDAGGGAAIHGADEPGDHGQAHGRPRAAAADGAGRASHTRVDDCPRAGQDAGGSLANDRRLRDAPSTTGIGGGCLNSCRPFASLAANGRRGNRDRGDAGGGSDLAPNDQRSWPGW